MIPQRVVWSEGMLVSPALYRLLSQGVPSKNRDVLSLSFASSDHGMVQLNFRPEGVRDLFARFTLPRSITPGAVACRR